MLPARDAPIIGQ